MPNDALNKAGTPEFKFSAARIRKIEKENYGTKCDEGKG